MLPNNQTHKHPAQTPTPSTISPLSLLCLAQIRLSSPRPNHTTEPDTNSSSCDIQFFMALPGPTSRMILCTSPTFVVHSGASRSRLLGPHGKRMLLRALRRYPAKRTSHPVQRAATTRDRRPAVKLVLVPSRTVTRWLASPWMGPCQRSAQGFMAVTPRASTRAIRRKSNHARYIR
jgi:hypothetical protein